MKPTDIELAKFSLFNNDRCTTPDRQVLLCNFIEEIRSGSWKDEVARCRDRLASDGEKAYKEGRGGVPAVSLSASVKTRRKAATSEEKCAVHSGLLQIDIDPSGFNGKSLDDVREIVQNSPHVVACFLSLSGKGIKGIARIPASLVSHAGCWEAIRQQLEAKKLTLDSCTKDTLRLCYVSHDPELYYNPNAVELEPVSVPEVCSEHQESSEGTEDPAHVHRCLELLSKKIGPYQLRSVWLHILGSTVDAVGEDAAGEIVDAYFPPQEDGHQSGCDVAHGWSGSWLSLRKYMNMGDPNVPFDPEDPLKDMPPFLEISDEESKGKLTLREQAYALRFDPHKTPPKDEIYLKIGDIPIASRANITVIQGKSKVGKSAVISAILGAAAREDYSKEGDTLCITSAGDGVGAIIHIDTEQSPADWHGLVSRSVIRSGLGVVSPRLVSLPLVMFARSERLEILRQTLSFEKLAQGTIDAVVIDGIADICKSPNDEEEALDLVSVILALSHEYNVPVFCVLHENPSTDAGKTRGHLGSELNRKAFANLRIDKDAITLVSTIYGLDMRKRDIPKERGFCFGWDEAARMHTFQGMAAGLRAALRKDRKVENSLIEWQGLFEAAEEPGTNLTCPELTPERAAEIERDIKGTEKPTSTVAMKKRMQRAEDLGVLKKAGAGAWVLSTPGQSGQFRDIL
jgi:hypothetical protein